MTDKSPLLFQFFASPDCVQGFTLERWQIFLGQAYKTGSVARANSLLLEHGLAESIPEPFAWHFSSAKKMKDAQQRDFTYTLSKLAKHLAAYKGEVVLLKGAAYAVDTENKVGQGRLFSDVDIYVNKADLDTVEQVLMWSGWKYDEKKSEYDINYYRNWMHELPPLTNKTVPLMLDLHHHLVPIISRQHFDMNKLAKETLETQIDRFRVLKPEAQLVHTALHMLTNDDMANISRDLLDFLFIYRDNRNEEFDLSLLELIDASGTSQHVLMAMNMLRVFFGEQMSDQITSRIESRGILDKWVDARYEQVIRFKILDRDPNRASWSQTLMWIRAHYLKMPTLVLLKHTLVKFSQLFVKDNKSNVVDG